jgi:hypothetical protein
MTNNDLQNIDIKPDIEQHEPLPKPGWTQVLRKVSSSCSTSGTRRVNLVTTSVISHEWGKNRKVFATLIFHNGQPSHGDDRKTFEVMTST